MPSLRPLDDRCAILTTDRWGRSSVNCDRPPAVAAAWVFVTPGPLEILLCDEHAAELEGHERLTLGGRLYDATVEG